MSMKSKSWNSKRDDDTYTSIMKFLDDVSYFANDKGDSLRKTVCQELSDFRQIVRKVFDTMMQDVNDVFLNQRYQIEEHYNQKYRRLCKRAEQLQREIGESSAPQARLENDRDSMLSKSSTARYRSVDKRDINVIAHARIERQELLHRLAWLKSEEDRMKDENKFLTQKLCKLLREQQEKIDESKILQSKILNDSFALCQ